MLQHIFPLFKMIPSRQQNTGKKIVEKWIAKAIKFENAFFFLMYVNK